MRLTHALSAAILLAAPALAQHPNDECVTSLQLTSNAAVSFDTVLASTSAPFPCGFGGNDIWFTYLVVNPVFDISLCGSAYDTVLEVFTGTCGALTSVACNDDSCGLRSALSFTNQFQAGMIATIRVGGYNGAVGAGQIVVNTVPPPASNDECSNASSLPPGALSVPFSNMGATAITPWPCGNGGADVWYSFLAMRSAVTVSTCGSSFDTVLEVFDGPDCGNLFSVGCDDDSCGLQSSVQASVLVGGLVFVRVGGFGGATGTGTLTISYPPDLNDECASAVQVPFDLPIAFDTTDATPSVPAVTSCVPSMAPDEWFTVPGGLGDYRVSLCGSQFDTVVEVYEAYGASPCTHLRPMACNDDFCGTSSEVLFSSNPGGRCFIRVTGYGGGSGIGTLTVRREQPLLNTQVFCTPAQNSTGMGSYILADGSLDLGQNDLRLVCHDAPPNSFGFFLISRAAGNPVTPPNSQGRLCLSGAIGRYSSLLQNSGPFGTFTLSVNNAQLPFPTGVMAAVVGQPYYFQCWHRDANPTVTSNLSAGLSVMWS